MMNGDLRITTRRHGVAQERDGQTDRHVRQEHFTVEVFIAEYEFELELELL
jgi:hypothetical protein